MAALGSNRSSPDSRFFGLLVAGGYLLVSGLLGTILLVIHSSGGSSSGPGPDAGAASTAETTTTSTDVYSSATSTAETVIPSGFTSANGPGGISTVIPTGWTAGPRTDDPGTIEADEPGSASAVGYGGSAIVDPDLVSEINRYEQSFASRSTGYQRITLRPVTYHNVLAVDWEYECDSSGGRVHVHARYWQTQGDQYLMYASSLVTYWPDMARIFLIMLDYTTP